jgi:hypothetical protein
MKKKNSHYMKKILYISLIASLIVSCTKLTEKPLSQISSNQFYQTVADGNAAVTALYSNLTHNYSGINYGTPNSGFAFLNRMPAITYGCASDDVITGATAPDPDYRAICGFYANSTNTKIGELWRQAFEIINNANIVITNVPKIPGDTAILNRYVREAKFIRGLTYYITVRLWGRIPLLTTPSSLTDNLQVSQADTSAIYALIRSDFTAATLLPKSFASGDGFRATSGAAHAFLLSVAVTQRNWNQAVAQYNILKSYPYSLFTNYTDIFNPANKNTKEHIFDVYFINDGTTGGAGNSNQIGASDAPKYGYFKGGPVGQSNIEPNVTLRQYFQKKDARTKVTYIDSVLNTSASKGPDVLYPHFNKWNPLRYEPTLKSFTYDDINIPIIRYAEVILLYAEAQNELGNSGEANAAINKIRARAGLPNVTTGLSKDNFRDTLFLERRIELAHEETSRWFDLVRLNGSGDYLINKAIPLLIDPKKGSPKDFWCSLKAANFAANPKKFLLLPIPLTELQANPNLVQNPGWQ